MRDANGTKLKVGDTVLIPAVIKSLESAENYGNAGVETTLGRRPDGQKEKVSAINTGVMVLYSLSEASVTE